MAERLRPVQMKFYVTEEEKNFIYKKMSLIGVKNLSAHLRKMAIDGQLVRIETTDLDACNQFLHISPAVSVEIYPDHLRLVAQDQADEYACLFHILTPISIAF